ncbi:MAG: rhodanese-like domain-containing protein [Actinomycetota bacterium]
MTVPEISVDELAALGPDVTLIDVREPDEWLDAHVAHAVHVPLGTVPDQLDQFSGSPTYVLCKVGGRSMRACEFAAAHGHDVVNVAGGILAWIEAGHAVEAGSDGVAGG